MRVATKSGTENNEQMLQAPENETVTLQFNELFDIEKHDLEHDCPYDNLTVSIFDVVL